MAQSTSHGLEKLKCHGIKSLLFLTQLFLLHPFFSPTVIAEPSNIGQTGLIHMPDARIETDGTLRLGFSHSNPYSTLWSTVTILPRLELGARYTEVNGVPGFANNASFGDLKDKEFDAKLLLLKESRFFPQLSIGTQDFLGTRLFAAEYAALSKRVYDMDLTIGYGRDRIDGLFGGIRYQPIWNNKLGFVVEYDANDYLNDPNAAQSGAIKRNGGGSYALEYQFSWLGTQVSYQDGAVSGNAFISIPLMVAEYIPNFDEPAPYTDELPQHDLTEWHKDQRYVKELIRVLNDQGFKNVQLNIDGKSLNAILTHTRISQLSRAVGRAARTLLLLGPEDIESIEIIYTVNDLAVVTYHFADLDILKAYFDGLAPQQRLEQSAEVSYTHPEYIELFKDDAALSNSDDENTAAPIQTLFGDEGHMISFRQEDQSLSSFRLIPFNLRFFFNDPSGAFHYDIFALLKYNKHIRHGLLFETSARATLIEDVSDVTQVSNSLLSHVRSDVAEYKQGDRIKLDKLLLNQYLHIGQRLYGRFSAGYYEEMYAGTGGQVMIIPRQGNWAMDLTVDWLKQRRPDDSFAFRDYSVVTALAGLHYRFTKYDLTTTARLGRFLAKDEGVRVEFKRRFRSGIEIGAWYTVTDGDDITSPGSPDDPYRDKGIFISIPLSSMLTKDTQQQARLSLSPWTRDVGQMVESPGDLFHLLERPLILDGAIDKPLKELDK